MLTGASLRRRRQALARSTTPSIRTIRRRWWAARSARESLSCTPVPSTKAPPPCAPMCSCSRRRPLDRELEVTGPGTVRLWIASDAPNADFTTKLIDVFRRAGTSARLPDEPDRGLVAGALSRQLGAAGTDGAGRGLSESASSCSPSPICSAVGTACGSTSRSAISRILTSTRILASRKAPGSSRASPATGSSPGQPAPRTSCCRSFHRASGIPLSVVRPASVRGADIPLRSVHDTPVRGLLDRVADLPGGGE